LTISEPKLAEWYYVLLFAVIHGDDWLHYIN